MLPVGMINGGGTAAAAMAVAQRKRGVPGWEVSLRADFTDRI
jgi:hypothetical protein